MKIAISALLFLFLVNFYSVSKAQEDKVNPAVDLNKIIVTSKRILSDLGQANENIAVINASQITKLPDRNLSEVLTYVQGVDIQPRQGFGRATSLSIQGCDPTQVKVMIDGIPLNTQSSGQVNPVEFPVENIERIEVIKGPASNVWGSGLGGVINIITKDTGKTVMPKGSITNSFAEFRTRKNDLDLSGKAGDLGYYFLSSYMQSGGKGQRDDVLEKKFFNKLSYDLKDSGKITGSFGYSGADVNSGVFPDGTWQSQPYRDCYGKLGWENDFGGNEFKVDLKHFRKKIVTESFNSLADELPSSRIETRDLLYQLSVNSGFHLRDKDLLVMGMDSDYDVVKSSAYLSKAKNVKIYAPYANYLLSLRPWDINFGLRYDYNSEFGKELSPSLGGVYHFQDMVDTMFKLGVWRAFNAPPLLWKFNENAAYSTTTNFDLKPERAVVYETSFQSQVFPKFWFKLSGYRSDVHNAIDNAEDSLGQVYKKNFQKYRRQGGEFQGKLEICQGLNFLAGAAFNDIEDRSTRKTARGGSRPRQSFDLGIEYKSKRGLLVNLIGYYDRWNEPASSEPKDRKMLFDAKISQDWRYLTVFLNIYNLSNTKYWADYYFPVRQRYFEGGLTFKW